MKFLKALAALLLLTPLSQIAKADLCPDPNSTTGAYITCPAAPGTPGSASGTTSPVVIYATTYGVKADGTHSDDVALKAAADACNTAGGHLVLPAGVILLDGTGSSSVTLDGCWMQGSGGTAGSATHTQGTTFNLTSTTVQPFILVKNWKLSDFNMYWPNQTTGNTVYPPAFTDNAATGMSHGDVDNVTLINAWDGFTSTVGIGSGDIKIHSSTMWALNGLFNLHATGDSWSFSNMRFTPGPYLGICGTGAACVAEINAGAARNAIWHATAGGSVTVVVDSTETFAWRYGVLVDASGSVCCSIFNLAWDGVGTLVDSSSGGIFYLQNDLTGSNSYCQISSYAVGGAATASGNQTCFNFGDTSGMHLHDFRQSASGGSFFVGAGHNSITIDNIISGTIGRANDGGEYYFANFTGAGNALRMQNSSVNGVSPATSHSHGINFTQANPFPGSGSLLVQNNQFSLMTDILTVQTNNTAIIQGNSAFSSYASGSSLNLTGTGTMIYSGNYWDLTPTALLSTAGNTQPFTAAQSALPFIMPGSGTMGNNGALSAIPATAATRANAYIFAYPGTIGNATATSVTITGTAGQFACTCTGLVVGQYMKLSGTYGGTGSITGYVDPTTYYVSATNGTGTFTLQTVGRSAISTTAGTPTGITYAAGGGWFYFQGSSTTAGTVCNTLYVSGTPAIPGSCTAFSTTGVGAYTATISVAWPGPLYTLAGGSLGLNGGLNSNMYYKYTNDANAKTVAMFLGGVTLLSAAPTTTAGLILTGQTTNAGSASVQEGWQQTITSGAGVASVEQTAGAQNTASDASLWIKFTLANAADTEELLNYSVQVRPN